MITTTSVDSWGEVRVRMDGRPIRVIDGVPDPIDVACAQLKRDLRRHLFETSNRVRRELGLPRNWDTFR